jgi:hypothetical protein
MPRTPTLQHRVRAVRNVNKSRRLAQIVPQRASGVMSRGRANAVRNMASLTRVSTANVRNERRVSSADRTSAKTKLAMFLRHRNGTRARWILRVPHKQAYKLFLLPLAMGPFSTILSWLFPCQNQPWVDRRPMALQISSRIP